MELQLTGQTAFVSGSTQGIGYSIARALLGEGATVVINGREQGRLQHTVRRLQADYPDANVSGVVADFGDPQQVQQLLAALGDFAHILRRRRGNYRPNRPRSRNTAGGAQGGHRGRQSDVTSATLHRTRRDAVSGALTEFTNCISTSFRPYFEHAQEYAPMVQKVTVPTAIAVFPKDLVRPARTWAERRYNVARYPRMPKGGHFAAHEVPDLLAGDIADFFTTWR